MKKKSSIVVSVLFCVILFVMFVSYLPKLIESSVEMIAEEVTMEEYQENVEEILSPDNIQGKYSFINLNGLFARFMGRQEYNEILRLKNGMLYTPEPQIEMQRYAEYLNDWKEAATKVGAKFIYVQAPGKMDLNNDILTQYAEDYSNFNTDELLKQASEQYQVNYIDLRPSVAATPEDIQNNFYRTDHHWNPKGAFQGFCTLMESLKKDFDPSLDISYTNKALWRETVVQDGFLGSRGKRVGVFYGGIDDLIYFTPEFDTEMSVSVPNERTFLKGSYEDCCISKKRITRDLFNNDQYMVYLDGNKGYMMIRNQNAPNKQKLLIVKDSYFVPVLSFLATEFAEIDVIDPRYNTDFTAAEYLRCHDVDYVFLMLNTSTNSSDEFLSTGMSALLANAGMEYTVILLEEDEKTDIVTGDSNYFRQSYQIPFRNNTSYSVSFSVDKATARNLDCVSLQVYDKEKDQIVLQTILDVDYAMKNGGFRWDFTLNEPEDKNKDLCLAIVPGIYGDTSDKKMTVRNLKVTESFSKNGLINLEYNQKIKLEPNDSSYNYYQSDISLKGGHTYYISIDEIRCTAGDVENVTVMAYCEGSRRKIQSSDWNIRKNSDYSWLIKIPDNLASDENCVIKLYAGLDGATQGNGLLISGFLISEVCNPYGDYIYYDNLELNAGQNARYSTQVPAILEPGKTYTVHANSVSFKNGNPWDLELCLVTEEQDDRIATKKWSLKWTPEDGYYWTFTVPEKFRQARLAVYAGSNGYTWGNDLVVEQFSISEHFKVNQSSLLYHQNEVELKAKDNNYNCYLLPEYMEPGKTYTLKIDGAEFNGSSTDRIVARIYSPGQKETIDSKTWYFNGDPYRFTWTFQTPEDITSDQDCQLEIYAGEPGKTRWTGVKMKNLSLYEEFA